MQWTVMILATSLMPAMPVSAQEVPVPSGLDVALLDVILEPDAKLARFRFVAPQIAQGAVPLDQVMADVTYLCEAVAVPGLAANGWTGGEVVVSLSAEPVPFGKTAIEVTQYFQPFSIADGVCIWEGF